LNNGITLNPLKTLVNKHCQRLTLSRHHLAIICGYTNSTKGLRQIDSFINTLVDANDISAILRSALGISIDEFKSAVEEQKMRIIEAERGKFKPHLKVVFSGEVTHPFYAGQAFSTIKLPSDLSEIDSKAEFQRIFELYKTHQLTKFNDTEYVQNPNDYEAFILNLEAADAKQKDYFYGIGKGYIYAKSYDDRYHFNRKGELQVE
jgi:hypothetical protein